MKRREVRADCPALLRVLFTGALLMCSISASALPVKVTGSGLPAAIPDPGTVMSTLVFPVSGPIQQMELFFEYTHQCEENLQAVLTSPTGTFVFVMVPGGKSCTGTLTTMNSTNDLVTGLYQGEEASGLWELSMSDVAPADGYSGSFDEWSLTIEIESVGEPASVLLLLVGTLGFAASSFASIRRLRSVPYRQVSRHI